MDLCRVQKDYFGLPYRTLSEVWWRCFTILKAFEDIIQIEPLKIRWEEIKRLQAFML